MPRVGNHPIVATENFIQSIREAGYKNTGAALSELVDNSIEAKARKIRIYVVGKGEEHSALRIGVLDDGSGMDHYLLRRALQFGGTDRFNSRASMGRFGMGLPNSSVSQARRVDVFSWRRKGEIFHTYLDVDAVAAGKVHAVPAPRRCKMPKWVDPCSTKSGTLVVWSRCDRFTSRSTESLVRELHRSLGRTFRHFLYKRVRILVNGLPLQPFDPLFRHPRGSLFGAKEIGPPILYRFSLLNGSRKAAIIRVRFSELPIDKWHDLPAEEKRSYGIVKGAGVSIVRAGREIAYGWYFMGGKRKENYDDWWRCEISFPPELDEYFRPTYTKQEISPTEELKLVLSPDVEATARLLNNRVRHRYAKIRGSQQGLAARKASGGEKYLPRTSHNTDGRFKGYRISVEPLEEESFYTVRVLGRTLDLVINRDHPFYERIYSPLCKSHFAASRFGIECLLLALARAETMATGTRQTGSYYRRRLALSNTLCAFLGT